MVRWAGEMLLLILSVPRLCDSVIRFCSSNVLLALVQLYIAFVTSAETTLGKGPN